MIVPRPAVGDACCTGSVVDNVLACSNKESERAIGVAHSLSRQASEMRCWPASCDHEWLVAHDLLLESLDEPGS